MSDLKTNRPTLAVELEVHGKCLDNIRYGKSNIPHAGRGAFATRSIRSESVIFIMELLCLLYLFNMTFAVSYTEGGLVAPAPLLHIPDRDILTMYAEKLDDRTGEEYRDISKPIGHQLLVNYCFGHKASSILLCPYGHETGKLKRNNCLFIVFAIFIIICCAVL